MRKTIILILLLVSIGLRVEAKARNKKIKTSKSLAYWRYQLRLEYEGRFLKKRFHEIKKLARENGVMCETSYGFEIKLDSIQYEYYRDSQSEYVMLPVQNRGVWQITKVWKPGKRDMFGLNFHVADRELERIIKKLELL